MVVDGALNVWLNNNENYIQSPNENLAREFMELMTLGVNNSRSVTSPRRPERSLATPPISQTATSPSIAQQHYSTPLAILGTTSKLDARVSLRSSCPGIENAKFITERLWFRFVSGSTTPPASLAESFANRDISSLVSALVHSVCVERSRQRSREIAGRVVRRRVPSAQSAPFIVE